MNQRLVVYFFEGKVGAGKVAGGWDALKEDAIKRDLLSSARNQFLKSLSEEEKERLETFSAEPRNDSKGEQPGSEREDEVEVRHAMYIRSRLYCHAHLPVVIRDCFWRRYR